MNWMILGATEYIFLRNGNVEPTEEERRDYDLSTGENLKLSLRLIHPTIGSFIFDYAGYGQHTIPSSVPDQGSDGYSVIGMLNLAYERQIFQLCLKIFRPPGSPYKSILPYSCLCSIRQAVSLPITVMIEERLFPFREARYPQ